MPYPRFIPAYAGNSEENRDFDRYITVHPRLRGELFIPAYAGNSEGQSIRAGSETVHPRLRGELTDELYSAVRRTGSSPLTRGTRE